MFEVLCTFCIMDSLVNFNSERITPILTEILNFLNYTRNYMI